MEKHRWCGKCGKQEEDHWAGVGWCHGAGLVGKQTAYKIRCRQRRGYFDLMRDEQMQIQSTHEDADDQMVILIPAKEATT